jgi:hypothetical protein
MASTGPIRVLDQLSGDKFLTELYRSTYQSNKEDAHILWCASVLLSVISMVISTMIPLGPESYLPPERDSTFKSVETAGKRTF